MLEILVDQPFGCAMRCLPIAARQPLPMRWYGEYKVALVRRGIIVRQRVDRAGRVAAIDIAGPTSAIPIAALAEHGAAGYAVDDAMLCLATSESLAGADLHGAESAPGRAASAIVDLLRAEESVRERVERIAEARARPTATSRVAGLVVAMLDCLSPALKLSTIPSSVQQRDLAALVAIRHESVCRSLTSLEARGLVARTASGLEVLDRAKLEAV